MNVNVNEYLPGDGKYGYAAVVTTVRFTSFCVDGDDVGFFEV